MTYKMAFQELTYSFLTNERRHKSLVKIKREKDLLFPVFMYLQVQFDKEYFSKDLILMF